LVGLVTRLDSENALGAGKKFRMKHSHSNSR
jgi:hypothetical protein